MAFSCWVGVGGLSVAIGLRFLVGVALAGVYPSGMKAVAGWFREGRGAALGVLIGALTVGSALPHLGRGLGLGWQAVIASASAAALVAAVIMHRVGDGPFDTQTAPFSWSHISSLVRHDGFRLATVGYVGHMWELYAMWTWVAAYLLAAGHDAPGVVFVVIASGAVGSLLAGSIADRHGRTIAAGGSLIISGSMILATPAVFHAPLVIMLPVVVVWGMSVVADSAQFSAVVTEVVGEQVWGRRSPCRHRSGFSSRL